MSIARTRPGPRALRAAVDEHVARDRQEMADVKRLCAVIESGEPWARTSPLHVTGSAIVVDRSSCRVLLRWHARMKAWMQVGGHADAGESDPWQIALREAREETGLPDLEAWPAEEGRRPIQIVIVPVPAHGAEPAHEHADIRYLLATARPHLAAAESDDTPLRWLAIDEALEVVVEDNLVEYLRRAKHLLAHAS
jgi:8-oxo-dGTP pyrophosphatase MutT (NUDIX family)